MRQIQCYQCEKCDKIFRTIEEYERHEKRNHTEKSEYRKALKRLSIIAGGDWRVDYLGPSKIVNNIDDVLEVIKYPGHLRLKREVNTLLRYANGRCYFNDTDYISDYANEYKDCAERMLEVLEINEKHPMIEEVLIENGRRLDYFLKSPKQSHRRKLAENGYFLDILINDESYVVRRAVAKQGYGYDILKNDENETVRNAAEIAHRNQLREEARRRKYEERYKE